MSRFGSTIVTVTCACAILTIASGDAARPSPSPTPMPSAEDCNLFKELLPPTKQAFDQHHLTAAKRSYILKYVQKIPAPQRGYAKWEADSDAPDGVLIFNAFPIYSEPPHGSHQSWVALNTNVGLDPIECRSFPIPIAQRGAGSSRNWPNIESVSSLRLPLENETKQRGTTGKGGGRRQYRQ